MPSCVAIGAQAGGGPQVRLFGEQVAGRPMVRVKVVALSPAHRTGFWFRQHLIILKAGHVIQLHTESTGCDFLGLFLTKYAAHLGAT